jgi:Glycosyl hydrolases family 2, sugar binding domain/Glycosyl hydrolases family 2, TIM barrel domain
MNRLTALALTSMVIAAGGSAQQWRPAPVTLMTDWGANVAPENAWLEYPRPQFTRERWQNLNGLWEYAVTAKTAPPPIEFDGQILVPFALEAALSGVGKTLQPTERLWYRRYFTVPIAWDGQRILLHFGAVDYECVVWVNGGLVDAHKGGFDSFSFDVTPFLKNGANELIVAVTDPSDTGEQPRGKQQLKPQGIWYTPVSGIWQTVWLEPVPSGLYLAELRLTPDLDARGLRVVGLTNEAIGDDTYAVRLTATANGRTAASTIVRVNREGLLKIPDARLWSPADPFLYDLKAELVRVKNPWPVQTGQGQPGGNERRNEPHQRFGMMERELYSKAEVEGEPLDIVGSYFGMRKVTIGPGPVSGQRAILLNGQPIFQHGPLDQGWWPDGLHTPPSDEAIRWEIEWLRQAGFNMLRKHIKVEPARYYYHCDKLGMLVWQDMPSGFNQALRNHPPDRGEPVRLSVSREQHELELRRMLGRLHNSPSIVTWVVFNEGWGQYETRAMAQWVKAIDRSRLVNANSGWLDMGEGDLYDVHTYDETPLTPKRQWNRAVVLGEYGGVGWPIQGHLWNPQMRNWRYQTYQDQTAYMNALRIKMEALVPMKQNLGLSAAVYTQTTDVEGEVNGFMTYDRKFIKAEPAVLRELNEPLTGN